MLDEIGGGIDDAGDQDLVLRDIDLLQVLPFAVVARVGGLAILLPLKRAPWVVIAASEPVGFLTVISHWLISTA
jgi:hypothetical protein